MNADKRRYNLVIVNDTFNGCSGGPEIYEQANIQVCSPKVVQTLRGMNLVQRLQSLDFDDHAVFNHNVCDKIPNYNSPVPYFYSALLFGIKPGTTELNGKRVLVNLLEESHSQSIANFMGAADDSPGNPIQISPALFECS